MSGRVPIIYRGFWDVPRIFLARHGGDLDLFDCAFDEALDEYPDEYKVFLLPNLKDEDLPDDWTILQDKALQYLGEVPVNRVQFDATRRQSIDAAVFRDVAARRDPG
jgi:hypothetical protein